MQDYDFTKQVRPGFTALNPSEFNRARMAYIFQQKAISVVPFDSGYVLFLANFVHIYVDSLDEVCHWLIQGADALREAAYGQRSAVEINTASRIRSGPLLEEDF